MLLPEPQLKHDIRKLLAYFTIFEYPLTSLEIWQLLPVKCSLAMVNQALDRPQAGQQTSLGCYYQSGCHQQIITKQQRYNISDQKFKRAKKISWLFSWLPWIKLICLANNIGRHNLRAGGDIDFFIVTSPQRLWLTRLFCVGLIKFLGLRPQPNKTADTICLSFLLDEEHLNLEPFLLDQAKDNPDRYFTYWLASLYPLYDTNNYYQRLIEQNSWLKKYLPNWQASQPVSRRLVLRKNNTSYNRLLDYVLSPTENWAKKFQQRILPPSIKTIMNQNKQVIVNDQVLKLHLTDRRQIFFDSFCHNLNNWPKFSINSK